MADYTIYTRKGESFDIEVSTDDTAATSAVLKMGTVGSDPLFTESATLTDGKGTISVTTSDTDQTAGTYKYQVNIVSDSGTDIFPDPTSRDQDLPDFVITEAF